MAKGNNTNPVRSGGMAQPQTPPHDAPVVHSRPVRLVTKRACRIGMRTFAAGECVAQVLIPISDLTPIHLSLLIDRGDLRAES